MNIFDLNGKINIDTKEYEEKINLLREDLEKVIKLIDEINSKTLTIDIKFGDS